MPSPLARAAIAWLLIGPAARAQDPAEFGPHGLVATYKGGGSTVERVEPAARLAGRAGESPHYGLPAGGFKVSWKGTVDLRAEGEYTFTATRSSLKDLTVTINGKSAKLGAPIAAEPGLVAFQVEGTHEAGEPVLDLWWRGPGFTDEPVPPRVFHHAADANIPAIADKGAVLAETLGCFQCHAGPKDWAGSLKRSNDAPNGPSLVGLGGRARKAWVAEWLLKPHDLSPGTPMPRVLDAEKPEDALAARTIAAYLTRAEPAGPLAAGADPKAGEAIVKAVGCNACHAPAEAGKADADLVSRVPGLKAESLRAKWLPSGLAAFLQHPLESRPHGRMPDSALTAGQAADIVAYLLGEVKAPANEDISIADADLVAQWAALGGDAARLEALDAPAKVEAVARGLMAGRGCVSCHQVDPKVSVPGPGPEGFTVVRRLIDAMPGAVPTAARPLVDLDPAAAARGCLSADTPGKAPRFGLDADQRAALSAYVGMLKSASPSSSTESLRISLASLNCVRCHQNEERGGGSLLGLIGGEEGRFYAPPTLTRTGDRVRPERLADWLTAGARDRGVHPWVRARMPGFGARGSNLAADLVRRDAADAAPATGPEAPRVARAAVRPEHQQLGRFLAGTRGLACVNCHAFQGRWVAGNPADPTTMGPDLSVIADHLRPEYYYRWMMDPGRVRPGTKMPQMIKPDGTVSVPTLTALSPGVPMDALWTYLSQGRGALAPSEEPTVVATPEKGRPVVQRGVTLADLGREHPKGMSLGFVDGTILYDADQLGPVAAWFGGFVEGRPENYFGMAWKRAGGGPVDILPPPGRTFHVQSGPELPWKGSPPLLESDLNDGPRFEGYQVGKSSIRLHQRLVAGGQRVEVTEDVRVNTLPGWKGFSRRLMFKGVPEGSRVSLSVPSAEATRRLGLDGASAGYALDASAAPMVAYAGTAGHRVVRVSVPMGSTWQDGPRADASTLPLLLPPAAGGGAVRAQVDWWAYAGPNPMPTAQEWAALGSEVPKYEDSFDDAITPRPLPTAAPSVAASAAAAPLPRPFRAPITPERNVEEFAPTRAKYVRLLVTATADGTAPGVDELEVFGANPEVNLALGARPMASSTHAGSEKHKLEHINDGNVGNDKSWIGGEPGAGWLGVELPAEAEVRRVVWARDRSGRERDRLATGYLVQVSGDGTAWRTVADAAEHGSTGAEVAPGYAMEPIPAPFAGCRPSDVAFGPDGMLYALAMTEGQVWRTPVPPPGRPSEVSWRRYATGLNHPIGLAIVKGRLFVSQKPEVTELIDRDGDGTVDQFKTVMSGWGQSNGGWHEYCFGLAYDNSDHLYVALTTGKFWTHPGFAVFPGRYRGSVFRVSLSTGKIEEVAKGLRTPNGVERGPKDEIYYTDNQGDWVQACKLAKIVPGRFYGHPEYTADALPAGKYPDGLSSVWLPYQWSRSASGPVLIEDQGRFGPFEGQMLVGDVGYGANLGLLRAAFEDVEGETQGAVFRFAADAPSGCLRMKFAPDGFLYLASLTTGLTRMRPEGPPPFALRAMTMRKGGGGFQLALTKPLDPAYQPKPEDFRFRRYHYLYTANYGSPEADVASVPVETVEVSADRTLITLGLAVEPHPLGMVYELDAGRLRAEGGEGLKHPEAWYTVHRVPKAP